LTRLALFIESLGITNFTWLLFGCLDSIMMRLHSKNGISVNNDDGNDDDSDADNDRLINIELGNRETFSFTHGKKNQQSFQYLSNPAQESTTVTV